MRDGKILKRSLANVASAFKPARKLTQRLKAKVKVPLEAFKRQKGGFPRNEQVDGKVSRAPPIKIVFADARDGLPPT